MSVQHASLIHRSVLGAAVAAALLAMPAAQAADAAPAASDWSFPATVGVVSDYIFRGQSQSWGKPSLQASVEADHASGIYVGTAFETVSSQWLPGAKGELDFFGGYRNKIADTVGYDVGAVYYTYPGGNWKDSVFSPTAPNSLNTLEVYASVSYSFLSLKAGRTMTEYFGWSTDNSPTGTGFAGNPSAGVTGSTKGSYFYEANASYDVVEGWTLSGQLGRQVIAHSKGLNINYYKVGVSHALPAGWSAGVFYSGTNEPTAYKNFISLANGATSSNIAKKKAFVTVSKAF
ncbi:TorF family putative porin [Uliginosibacterium sediminicola]|uniref:TorF family putative porin n=1 Tax=Uliginosibacterium sediminicola TaxID=2024550 RepID=A0ABU9YY39_9RHOO